MNWEEFKDTVDAQIADACGKNIEHSEIEIDCIDIGCYGVDIELNRDGDGKIQLRIL
jgi:hypothetical protein